MQEKEYFRPTWAEISLDAIKYNLLQIKESLSGDVKVMAVVKANAYGHGIVEVSRALNSSGVDYLGVASIDEAAVLRRNNIKCPILVLGSALPGEIEAALKYEITLTACNTELLEALDKEARRKKTRAVVHVKIDTGMGRIGVWHEEAAEFIRSAAKYKNINLEGAYTHFAIAGRDKFFTGYQMESFNKVIDDLKISGIDLKFRHAANSIATIGIKKTHLNMVRPGIVIYGMYPKKSFSKIINLMPALSLKTRVVYLKCVPSGRSISYGRTFITEKSTKIATIPIGYADGYGRILSNKAEVLIRGQRARVIGKVTMDQTMLDVGNIKDIRLGDEVVLIGKQAQDEIRTEELAKLCGTIPYEIVCSIGSRVPRVYI
ncbi:MAG: alanine racemase [Candidatus Omnitrophota bacterium]